MKNLFLLDKDIVYLNFGSFGACPKEIFEDYIKWQYLLEKEPVQFIAHNGINYVKTALNSLADYIHCDSSDLVFVPNPTFAVNILAKNIKLSPEDEILTTNLEYGALDRTWNFYCNTSGAKYVQQPISLPIQSKEAFLKEFWKGYSDKTKVVFISHITSSTALILPVKEICEEAKKRGLLTIVDGAHVPGHIDLDLSEIEADFYTGACHKWMMTPKGCSFLYAKPELQKMLDPLIISWGYESTSPSDSQFFDYHQFNGTRDFSAYLTVPKAIKFMEKHNWKTVAEDCKEKLLSVAPTLFEVLKTNPLAPLNKEFYGQICSAEITTPSPEKLKELLFNKYHIEIPIMKHGDKCFIRFSFQAFNTTNEIAYLVQCIREIIKETDLIQVN